MKASSFVTLAAATLAVLPCTDVVEAQQDGSAVVQSLDSEYLIGPGDTLQIFVWRQPELSVIVPVRPDGKISTPLVDDVVAVDKTPTQLAADIKAVLSEYVRDPQVSIIVQAFVGTFSGQIRVIGQAGQPKSIPYRDNMTVLDVVIEAGGLTEFAAGNRSRIVRTVNGRREEIRVKLDDLINKGKIDRNVVMKPGDVLVIPESVF